MDKRLKHIVDNLDNMKIGVDDSFRFGCKQCGKCCINREDILLTPKDLYKLAAFMGKKIDEVVAKYCETYLGQSSRIPIVRLKPQGSIKRCPLLKDRRCSVHQAKPVVCAMYPVGRFFQIEQDKSGLEAMSVDGIGYILNKVECFNGSETHTVKEWLESFGVPIKDPFFVKWHQTLSVVGKKIHEIEPKYPDTSMELIWNLVYAALYLNYDVKKDFMDQFSSNADKLIDAMQLLPDYEEAI